MAEIMTLEAANRTAVGTRGARKLRQEGIVPGNLFGHGQSSKAIQMTADNLRAVLHKGAKVVDLTIGGQAEKALLSEIQWDTFGQHLLHADFMRVDANERVHVHVPVHLRGTAPGATSGGILEQPLHSLNVECLAIEIPNEILVKIGHLQVGDAIHVRDLTDIPAGVKILDDAEKIVVHVVQPRLEVVAPVGEAGPAEPELIGRPKAEDEPVEEKKK
jgi:large subunit ribosomal protein L25